MNQFTIGIDGEAAGRSVKLWREACPPVPPSFARPSRRHQRARRARPAYRAQSRNRPWCCWPPSTLARRRRGARSRYRAGRFRVCRQHLCDNGGDGADIAGAVGKQHGVTVLDGKRHSGEDRTVLEKLSCPNWRVVEGPAPGAMPSVRGAILANSALSTYFASGSRRRIPHGSEPSVMAKEVALPCPPAKILAWWRRELKDCAA